MITEKEFLRSHRAFWHNLLPMSEHFVREQNELLNHYEEPLGSGTPADGRGVVNEMAFLLFAEAVRAGLPDARALDAQILADCSARALQHVKNMRAFHRRQPRAPGPAEIVEASQLASRTLSFFLRFGMTPEITQPTFPGCGWLDACQGDVLSGTLLVEVKAGDRKFLSVDLQQLLTYAALNFAAKKYEIDSVALVNPRLGNFCSMPVEFLCQRVSGRPAIEVLSEIVDYISEPVSRYGSN